MAKNTFERMEKKYLLNQEQFEKFLALNQDKIQLDQYGLHTISNIYYDTENDECIRWSIEKPQYKEKLRIRTYQGEQDDPEVFVEIKKKFDGIVYKRRIATDFKDAIELCGGYHKAGNDQIRKEIEYFVQFYKPIPKLYLAYDRMAYFGLKDDIRITFDRNIRYRTEELSLRSSNQDVLLSKPQQMLMEIKVNHAMPLWLSRALSLLEIYPVSYSKYGNIYKESLQDVLKREEKFCLPAYSTVLQEV